MAEFFIRHADATQILLFAGAISLLWAIEHLVISLPEGEKLRHTGVNALFALTALPIELVLSAACLAVSRETLDHGLGLVNLFPDPSSVWVRDALMFVALDLFDYLYHRLMHHVPPLWRFHLVHHTDQHVDSSTTVREHPGETAIRSAALVVWTFLLGASFEVLLMRQAAETVFAILAHSALRMPPGVARVMGFLFVTPNLHHVHHHNVLPYTDSNFGGVFSVWDRLFGTFAELEAEDTVFGLDTHMEPTTVGDFGSLVAMPFAQPITGASGKSEPTNPSLAGAASALG